MTVVVASFYSFTYISWRCSHMLQNLLTPCLRRRALPAVSLGVWWSLCRVDLLNNAVFRNRPLGQQNAGPSLKRRDKIHMCPCHQEVRNLIWFYNWWNIGWKSFGKYTLLLTIWRDWYILFLLCLSIMLPPLECVRVKLVFLFFIIQLGLWNWMISQHILMFYIL